MIAIAPRLCRPVFWLYAAVLVTLTHWPKLEIHAPIERPDLYVHLGAFGLWTLLFQSCGYFGPRRSVKPVLTSGAVALAWCLLDEATQAIPIIRRQARWDDAGANVLGVVLATVAWLVASRLMNARRAARGPAA